MTTEERRGAVLARLREAGSPLSGTKLAREFGVSRQIIVGDISILRAEGEKIYATPRGYFVPESEGTEGLLVSFICRHSREEMEQELLAFVDNGGEVLDVIVEHPVYGPLKADLLLTSRRDVKNFLTKMQKCEAAPISIVTGGIHVHTVRVPDEEALEAIREELEKLGVLEETGV